MWRFHDRLDDGITEASCKAEIASFMTHGQQVCVLGRALRNDPTHDIELIYGARRLFIARHLNVPLRVNLCAITDREAIIAMDIENRQRQELSAYERGLSYARLLRAKLFASQDEIAKALRVSPSQVSRLLKIASLSKTIIEAFGNPLELRESWGLDLYQVCQDDTRCAQLEDIAHSIARFPQRPAAEKIYKQMMLSQKVHHQRAQAIREEIVRNGDGAPRFRVRRRQQMVTLMIPKQEAPGATLTELKHVVREVLQHASA
jgi:ParB/RepB/Spo0J family partition protein